MTAQQGEYERIKAVLENAEEPMTAREIMDAIEDTEIDSAHRVATVLGRQARYGKVDVIRDRPYRYRMEQ